MEDHRPRPRDKSYHVYDEGRDFDRTGAMFKLDGDGYDFRMQIWNDVSFSGEMLLWESSAKAHYEQAIARSVACRLAEREGERAQWVARANDFAEEYGFERIENAPKEPEYGYGEGYDYSHL